jgi:hypothetical protein
MLVATGSNGGEVNTFDSAAWYATYINAKAKPPVRAPDLNKIAQIANRASATLLNRSYDGSAGCIVSVGSEPATAPRDVGDDGATLEESVIEGIPYTLVDNPGRLRLCTSAIEEACGIGGRGRGDGDGERERAVLAIDLEGVGLGQSGAAGGGITSVQICMGPKSLCYIVDVVALGGEVAFRGPSSLQTLLEHSTVVKLFWDCRNDVRALFEGFQIRCGGVLDLQLIQVACGVACGRVPSRLGGLGTAIKRTLAPQLSHAEIDRLVRVKDLAHRVFAPDLGGSYEMWKVRPLSPLLLEYMTDVRYFHMLRQVYAIPRALLAVGVEVKFAAELAAANAARVSASCSPTCAAAITSAAKTKVEASFIESLVHQMACPNRRDDRSSDASSSGVLVPQSSGGCGASKADNAHRVNVFHMATKTRFATPLLDGGGGGGGSGSDARKLPRLLAAGKTGVHTQSKPVSQKAGGAAVAASAARCTPAPPVATTFKAAVAQHVVHALKPYRARGMVVDDAEFRSLARMLSKKVVAELKLHTAHPSSSCCRRSDGGRYPIHRLSSREIRDAAKSAVLVLMCDRDPLGTASLH